MRELEGKAAGDERDLYLPQRRTGRWDASDAIPDTAGDEAVTRPLNRMP